MKATTEDSALRPGDEPVDKQAGLSSAVPWRRRLYVVIFRHDTPAGARFDVILLILIAASVLAVMLESVESIRQRYGPQLIVAEWFFTILFTVEYILRILSVRRARHYVLSPLGIIDLLAIVPTYLSVVLGGAQTFTVIRALRLLRVFRVLKLPSYLSEASLLSAALHASRRKITVFVFTVLTIVLIVGAMMYVIEGPANGFSSIPLSVYWAIVTLTTVGYGDIAPQTPVGQMLASMVMILGYGIIAVPTGIVTAELISAENAARGVRRCGVCGRSGHDSDAAHCKYCGKPLPGPPAS